VSLTSLSPVLAVRAPKYTQGVVAIRWRRATMRNPLDQLSLFSKYGLLLKTVFTKPPCLLARRERGRGERGRESLLAANALVPIRCGCQAGVSAEPLVPRCRRLRPARDAASPRGHCDARTILVRQTYTTTLERAARRSAHPHTVSIDDRTA